MVHNGLRYFPTPDVNGHVLDTVQCTWCGLTLGPFPDIVPIKELHLQGNRESQRISCPFACQ